MSINANLLLSINHPNVKYDKRFFYRQTDTFFLIQFQQPVLITLNKSIKTKNRLYSSQALAIDTWYIKICRNVVFDMDAT